MSLQDGGVPPGRGTWTSAAEGRPPTQKKLQVPIIIQLLCTTKHVTNKAHFISNADHVTLLRSLFWPLGGEGSPAHLSVSSDCF